MRTYVVIHEDDRQEPMSLTQAKTTAAAINAEYGLDEDGEESCNAVVVPIWASQKAREVYDRGWQASRRSVTCDLDAAQGRYEQAHGGQYVDFFIIGWTDYAVGNDKYGGLGLTGK